MRIRLFAAGLAIGACGIPQAQAFNFGDMMNPGRWFGGSPDRGDYAAYGYDVPPPPPYAAGGGYGYPGQPAYGYPAYGGQPGYGYQVPAAPAHYGQPAIPPAVPENASVDSASERRIRVLEQRIRELEAAQAVPAPVPQSSAAPPSRPEMVFRPMDQE